MSFAAKAIGTLHAALEVSEEILDCVGRLTVLTDIVAALVPAMLDGLVSGKLFADVDVELAFIGVGSDRTSFTTGVWPSPLEW